MGLAIEATTNINDIDFSNFFTYLTVHEFGHVYTLNETQVNVFQDNCPAYHTGEGCSNSDSYINQLYARSEMVDLRNRIIQQNPTLKSEGMMTRSWAKKYKFKCGHKH